ncbi:MAG: ABC transporter permease [Clostridiales bacterium]|nr:ABC transporter permease [Clostridiales bacterium]
MITLIRSTLKILFRNKGFWFFLFFTPILAVGLLAMNIEYSVAKDPPKTGEVLEITASDKVAYITSGQTFGVKVYDAAESDMSRYFMQDLSETGMFSVLNLKSSGMTKEEYLDQVKEDVENDRMGASVFLPSDFDERIRAGQSAEAVIVSITSDDERAELLAEEVRRTLTQMCCQPDIGILQSLKDSSSSKQLIEVASSSGNKLTKEQKSMKVQLGYSFSFLTLGFVFCGIFVAHTAIEEQKNGVLTRIRLTGNAEALYFVSKFVVSVFTSVLMTAIMAVSLLIVDETKLGMSHGKLILLVFLMGIIFSTLSLFIGIMAGEVAPATYAAFVLWSMSSALSGMYFSLDNASGAIRGMSYLMPQKWFSNAAELFYIQDKTVYFLLLCVTASYLMVILSLGSVGLKMRKKEE